MGEVLPRNPDGQKDQKESTMKFTMNQKKIISQFHEIAGIFFMILAIYFFILIKNFRFNSPISFAIGMVCVVVLWFGNAPQVWNVFILAHQAMGVPLTVPGERPCDDLQTTTPQHRIKTFQTCGAFGTT